MSIDQIGCEIVRPDALSPSDGEAWVGLCAGHPAYASPLMQPCFPLIAALNRDDVRVALYRRGGQLVGAFAFYLRPGHFARPAGAPFADFCGPVLAQDSGLDLQRDDAH